MCTSTSSKSKRRDLASLPKAELHLHLEGAMRPGTLNELCEKYSIPTPNIPCWNSDNTPIPATATEIEPFDDFSAFVDVYIAACACLRTKEDVHRLVLEVAQDLKLCHVVYAEVAPSFTFYSQYFGSSMEKTLKVLVDAAEVAEKETGVQLSYVVSAERQLGVEDAMELAHLARSSAETMQINGRQASVGFGLHGPEENHPSEPFKDAFQLACSESGNSSLRLASLPHAGEIGPSPGMGSKSVLAASQTLNAKRIAHGVLAKDDAKVIQLLKERDIVLDMGITSNYLLKVVKSREEHPIQYF